eukprot:g24085.t1
MPSPLPDNKDIKRQGFQLPSPPTGRVVGRRSHARACVARRSRRCGRMTHQRSGPVEGEDFIEFQDTQYVTGHIQRMYRFYMFLPEHGSLSLIFRKPYKTMWVTDLDYVRKERDRCLELQKKKLEKRKKSPSRGLPTLDPFHPRSGEIPHGLILSTSRYLSVARPRRPTFIPSSTAPGHPGASLGTSILERHRVLHVCLGREHGVLLSDAGIAFTWGDNRYGQLGRPPVLKEENGRPFPVVGLADYEVTQVSAGTHHCLALVAPGLVWSWGRNKDGQLGVGDFRDRIHPVEVCHPPILDGADSTLQLGANKGQRPQLRATVTRHTKPMIAPCIDVAAFVALIPLSLAAAMNSNVWQWGQISSNFNVANTDKSRKSGIALVQNRPYLIFEQTLFRSQMRAGRVSISSTGCKVLHQSLGEERQHLAELNKTTTEAEAPAAQQHGGDEDELATLQDTIGQLERDIMLLERDIEAYGKSLESCDLRQAHNRKQLQQLQQQGTSLRDRQDQVSLNIYMAPKAGAERRKLEEQLTEVEEFVQANKNTRMTLLDQRAETDKAKQKILAQLANSRKQRERFQRRLDIVKDLSKSSKASSSGASDPLIKVLDKQCQEMSEYFSRRQSVGGESKEGASGELHSSWTILNIEDFLAAMKIHDADRAFLDQIEQKMKDVVDNVISNGTPERAERARLVNQMLVDMVNLRRSWCDMLQDRWASDGLDLSCFFEGSTKPSAADPREVREDFEEDWTRVGYREPPSLLQTPQLPGLSLFRSPDDAMAQGRSNAFLI